MAFRRVVIESPLSGEVEANIAYAKQCVRDSLSRGEAPYASHLFFAQPGILDDRIPTERKLGIEAGIAWGSSADLVAAYVDKGISPGMVVGLRAAAERGTPIELRALDMPETLRPWPSLMRDLGLDSTSDVRKQFASRDRVSLIKEVVGVPVQVGTQGEINHSAPGNVGRLWYVQFNGVGWKVPADSIERVDPDRDTARRLWTDRIVELAVAWREHPTRHGLDLIEEAVDELNGCRNEATTTNGCDA